MSTPRKPEDGTPVRLTKTQAALLRLLKNDGTELAWDGHSGYIGNKKVCGWRVFTGLLTATVLRGDDQNSGFRHTGDVEYYTINNRGREALTDQK